MSEHTDPPNIIIQAVKPVSYIASLVQSAGRILVAGLAVILVFVMGGYTFDQLSSGSPLERLLAGDMGDGEAAPLTHVGGDEESENKFLILDLAGVILGTPPYPVQDSYVYSMYDVTFGYQLRDQILAAAEDETIRGILIHTRTPGGTIFGSMAIHEGITRYREETGRPVVVWIEGMSASGGVYSTAAASAIYAAPGSAIGSIGVIGGSEIYYNKPTAFQSGLFDSGVVTEEGIEVSYMHAGRGKDAGNPFRRMTEEERAIRQEGLDRSYEDFVNHVSKGRGIEPAKIVDELGAHIYGNFQAVRYGLIDATLSLEAAWSALALLAGVEGEDFSVVRRSPPKQSLLDDMLAEDSAQHTLFSKLDARVVLEKCKAANQVSLVFHGNIDRLCGL